MTYTAYVSMCNHLVANRGYDYILTNDDWVQVDTEEKACYTAGLIEYCANRSILPAPKWYEKLERKRLPHKRYPDSVILLSRYDKKAYERAYDKAIPEFLKHNIIIEEVGNSV